MPLVQGRLLAPFILKLKGVQLGKYRFENYMYKFMSKKHIFSNNSKSIGLRPPNTIEVEQKSGRSGTFGTIFMSLSVMGTEICQKI